MTQGLPLTYPDLVGLDDLDAYAGETTSDLQTLLQDVYHVLIELLGTNLDDPTRGVGALQYLSGTLTQLAQLPPIIEAQLTTDMRISSASAQVLSQASGPYPYILTLKIAVSGSVLGLQYGYSQPAGLVPL